MIKFILASALALGLSVSSANADALSTLQHSTLQDVRQAEAIYAANTTIPTYAAAEQCLSWADATLSSPNAPITLGVLPPEGVVSTIADLDVALSTQVNIPPIVDEFNAHCGWYTEDLKAQAAMHATIHLFGFNIL